MAQVPPTGGDPAALSTPAKTQKVADLTSRYRFVERYATKDETIPPGSLGAYRVSLVEVFKDSTDTPKAAPKRTESTRKSIFTERPLELGGVGTVASVARTYEIFQAKPDDPTRRLANRPLEGVSVLVVPKLGELPQILSLTEGRSLTEYEFEVIGRQMFVANLASLLPAPVVRIGDTWRAPRKAAQALLGDPYLQGDSLFCKLTEIRKEIDGPRMVASITITGKTSGPSGDTVVNAELLFTFQSDSSLKAFPEKAQFPSRPTEDVVEARGAITELRLGRVTSVPLPGPGRLRFQSNREVILHRQLGLLPGAVAPPKLAKVPEATEANSWIVHVDPAGRYAFQHPQDLLPPERSQPTPEANTTLLIRTRREGRDMLQLEYVPKILTPDDLKKELAEKYGMLKMEIIKGEEVWLPEAEWPKMRVHRIDAEVKLADSKAASTVGAPRIHFDGYLILFGQSASIMVVSTTSRAPGPYRQEIEKILKSIQLNPPRAAID